MKNTEGDFEDINPREILEFAGELDEIKDDLDSSKSAVNRTIYVKIYYAVFLFLREWLKQHMNYQSRVGEHTKLPNFIKKKGPFAYHINKQIYRDLLLLKKLRHQADYRLTVPSRYSQEFHKWEFTSIADAFKIAESIIKAFKGK
ncbi:MAG: hypothetical protein IJ287_04335 [Methanobrevibacter sp.]|nr:hypothetical protein [Methanobrevibacter sp.]